jgi:hypothetical protein
MRGQMQPRQVVTRGTRFEAAGYCALDSARLAQDLNWLGNSVGFSASFDSCGSIGCMDAFQMLVCLSAACMYVVRQDNLGRHT